MNELLLWIQRLHLSRPMSLYTWRRDNKFGRRQLSQQFDQAEYDELVEALKESNSLVDDWRAMNPNVVKRFQDSNRPDYGHLEIPAQEREE